MQVKSTLGCAHSPLQCAALHSPGHRYHLHFKEKIKATSSWSDREPQAERETQPGLTCHANALLVLLCKEAVKNQPETAERVEPDGCRKAASQLPAGAPQVRLSPSRQRLCSRAGVCWKERLGRCSALVSSSFSARGAEGGSVPWCPGGPEGSLCG